MQAVCTIVPEPFNSQVKQTWSDLETHFGLSFARLPFFPHFTWQVGDSYQDEEVLACLHGLTQKLEPLAVDTVGINHFDGASPVLFVEIRKTQALLDLHATIWNQLIPFTREPSMLYSVGIWQPHITLAMEDLSWDQLSDVTDFLKKKDFHWHFQVESCVIACQQTGSKAQIEHVFSFGRGLTQSFDCGLPSE